MASVSDAILQDVSGIDAPAVAVIWVFAPSAASHVIVLSECV